MVAAAVEFEAAACVEGREVLRGSVDMADSNEAVE